MVWPRDPNIDIASDCNDGDRYFSSMVDAMMRVAATHAGTPEITQPVAFVSDRIIMFHIIHVSYIQLTHLCALAAIAAASSSRGRVRN